MAKENGEAIVDDIPDAKGTTKKEGLQLLIHDFKQPKLIPIKILTFLTFSGYGVLIPFMPNHMKSLGMNIEEIGVVYAVSSFCIIVGPFCAGLIADKMGNFKVLLWLSHGLVSLTTVLFMWIPVGRLNIDYPANLSLVISCDNGSLTNHAVDSLVVTISDSNPCELNLTEGVDQMMTTFSVTIESCDYLCDGSASAASEFNTTSNAPVANVSVLLDSSINKTFPVLMMSMDPVDGKSLELMDDLQCNPSKPTSQLYGSSNSQRKGTYCRTNCKATTPRLNLCSNLARKETLNPRLTFWFYISVRLAFDSLIAGGGTQLESASLALSEELRSDYGLQKVFGFIGISIFSPVSGVLIDYFTVDENEPAYGPAFYMFAGLFGAAAIGMLAVDLDFKQPATNLLQDVKSVLKSIQLNVLFIFTFIAGTLLGASGNFLFIFLDEIGASKSLMGFSVMVACLSAIPILLTGNLIFKKFGHPNVLVGCMAFYVIRLLGYSYLIDPSWCLLLESIEAITGTLTITSIMNYAAQLGTKSTLASVQGCIATSYYGLGGGVVGSLVTSFIIQAYGQRLTFRILALIAFITGFTYSLFNIFYIRRKNLAKSNEEGSTSVA